MSAQDDYRRSQRRQIRAERRAASKAGERNPKKPKGHKPKKPKAPSRLDDPSYVTRPRTMREIGRDADSAVGLRYGQEEAALNLTARQTPAWFEQYKGQVAGINTGIQQGYAQAIKDIDARTKATQTANDTSRSQLMGQQQADAASRGATVDPTVFTDDAAAANVRRQGADAQANLLTTQGQATGDYFGGVQAAAGSAQIAQQQQNAELLRGLLAEKGQARAGYVSDARDAERKYGLERSAFGLDVAKAEQDAQIDRSKLKLSRRQDRARQHDKDEDQSLARQRERRQAAKDEYARAHPKTPKAKAKPKQTAKTTDTKAKIRTGVHRVRSRSTNLPGYWEESYKTLVEVDGIDPVVARAIVQGAKGGKLGPKTAKALRDDYGITGLRFPKPKRKRKPKSPKTVVNPFD